MRLVTAGQPLREQPHCRWRHRRRYRLWCRGNEPGAARGQRGPGHRESDSRGPSLRHARPVQRGRADRPEIRHHPGKCGLARARVTAKGSHRCRRGPLRSRDHGARRANCWRRGSTRRAQGRADVGRPRPRPSRHNGRATGGTQASAGRWDAHGRELVPDLRWGSCGALDVRGARRKRKVCGQGRASSLKFSSAPTPIFTSTGRLPPLPRCWRKLA